MHGRHGSQRVRLAAELGAALAQRLARGQVLVAGGCRHRRPQLQPRRDVVQPPPWREGAQRVGVGHQVRHLVAQVGQLRERAHLPVLRRLPLLLHLGQRDAHEHLLLHLVARLHAALLAARERRHHLLALATHLRGSVHHLLRQLARQVRASGAPRRHQRLARLALVHTRALQLAVQPHAAHRRGSDPRRAVHLMVRETQWVTHREG